MWWWVDVSSAFSCATADEMLYHQSQTTIIFFTLDQPDYSSRSSDRLTFALLTDRLPPGADSELYHLTYRILHCPSTVSIAPRQTNPKFSSQPRPHNRLPFHPPTTDLARRSLLPLHLVFRRPAAADPHPSSILGRSQGDSVGGFECCWE